MSTSGTYNFGSTINEQFIIESFMRVGLLPDLITAQMLQSAILSMNLLFSQWLSRGINLWMVQQNMLNLTNNQATYSLPVGTSMIYEATRRTSSRQLGGTAFSSAGGTAQNAFSGTPGLACTQTAPNGYISYNYGTNNGYLISLVGVQSNVTTTYTLVAEYSFDNVNWLPSITIPAQTYTAGSNVWFIVPVPVVAQYYRIRETGGATLNIQELYFNTNIIDIPITAISRSEWVSYPNKLQTGVPTSYYFNRQINPTLTLWPTPVAPYFNIFYTSQIVMQDIGSLTNMPQIPQWFYEPLASGLAWMLSMKYKPEKTEYLKVIYDEAFNVAARDDNERVPTRIYGNYMQGWGRPTC